MSNPKIDRAIHLISTEKWRLVPSALYEGSACGCVIGCLALQCGIPPSTLRGIDKIDIDAPSWMDLKHFIAKEFDLSMSELEQLVKINDYTVAPSKRIKRVVKFLKKINKG